METRLFGERTGMRVSNFALGTGRLGLHHGYGTDPDEAQRILSLFAERGGNLFAVSDAYQGGASEETVGEFIAGRRADFVIATKYSRTTHSAPSAAAFGNSRKAMIQAVEGSLRRLKTDYIDVYMPHFDDGVTPIEEILRGLEDLTRAGKVVYCGLSNFPAWRVAAAATLADARGWNSISAIEVEHSLLQRTTERDLLPTASAFGLAVLAYSPLAGGVLSGKYRRGESGRATTVAGSVPHSVGDNSAVLDALETVAAKLGASCAGVAIAWVVAKGSIPILGAKTVLQLEENLAATNVVLSYDALHALDAASSITLGYPNDLLAATRGSNENLPLGTDLPNRVIR